MSEYHDTAFWPDALHDVETSIAKEYGQSKVFPLRASYHTKQTTLNAENIEVINATAELLGNQKIPREGSYPATDAQVAAHLKRTSIEPISINMPKACTTQAPMQINT